MVHFTFEFYVLEMGSVQMVFSALINWLLCHHMQMFWFYQMAMNTFLPCFILELKLKVEN